MEEEKKNKTNGVVEKMSTELGAYCVRRLLKEKMSLVEVFSTISMMSCLMIDSLARSTGRDPRTLIDGYIETVKMYKTKEERNTN